MDYWNTGPARAGVRISVGERLTDFPAGQDDEPAGLYQSRAWFEAVQKMSAETTRYVIATDDDRVVGVLPVYVMDSARAGYYHPREAFGLTDDFDGVLAVVGGRGGYLTGWALAGGDAAAGVLTAMLRAAGALAADHGARAVTVQYLPAGAARLLADTGLVDPDEPVVHSAAAAIALPGTCFEDYLGTLPAHRRTVARRELRRFREAGLTARTCRLSEAMSFVPGLVAKVAARHGGPIDAGKMRAVLDAQSAYLDRTSVVVAATGAEAGPVACSLSYAYRGTLHVRMAGLDYDAARSGDAYFVTTYYETIRQAYRLGLTSVDFGVAPYRPKVLRGARLQPLYGVLRDRTRTPMPAARRAEVRAWASGLLHADLGTSAPSSSWWEKPDDDR